MEGFLSSLLGDDRLYSATVPWLLSHEAEPPALNSWLQQRPSCAVEPAQSEAIQQKDVIRAVLNVLKGCLDVPSTSKGRCNHAEQPDAGTQPATSSQLQLDAAAVRLAKLHGHMLMHGFVTASRQHLDHLLQLLLRAAPMQGSSSAGTPCTQRCAALDTQAAPEQWLQQLLACPVAGALYAGRVLEGCSKLLQLQPTSQRAAVAASPQVQLYAPRVYRALQHPPASQTPGQHGSYHTPSGSKSSGAGALGTPGGVPGALTAAGSGQRGGRSSGKTPGSAQPFSGGTGAATAGLQASPGLTATPSPAVARSATRGLHTPASGTPGSALSAKGALGSTLSPAAFASPSAHSTNSAAASPFPAVSMPQQGSRAAPAARVDARHAANREKARDALYMLLKAVQPRVQQLQGLLALGNKGDSAAMQGAATLLADLLEEAQRGMQGLLQQLLPGNLSHLAELILECAVQAASTGDAALDPQLARVAAQDPARFSKLTERLQPSPHPSRQQGQAPASNAVQGSSNSGSAGSDKSCTSIKVTPTSSKGKQCSSRVVSTGAKSSPWQQPAAVGKQHKGGADQGIVSQAWPVPVELSAGQLQQERLGADAASSAWPGVSAAAAAGPAPQPPQAANATKWAALRKGSKGGSSSPLATAAATGAVGGTSRLSDAPLNRHSGAADARPVSSKPTRISADPVEPAAATQPQDLGAARSPVVQAGLQWLSAAPAAQHSLLVLLQAADSVSLHQQLLGVACSRLQHLLQGPTQTLASLGQQASVACTLAFWLAYLTVVPAIAAATAAAAMGQPPPVGSQGGSGPLLGPGGLQCGWQEGAPFLLLQPSIDAGALLVSSCSCLWSLALAAPTTSCFLSTLQATAPALMRSAWAQRALLCVQQLLQWSVLCPVSPDYQVLGACIRSQLESCLQALGPGPPSPAGAAGLPGEATPTSCSRTSSSSAGPLSSDMLDALEAELAAATGWADDSYWQLCMPVRSSLLQALGSSHVQEQQQQLEGKPAPMQQLSTAPAAGSQVAAAAASSKAQRPGQASIAGSGGAQGSVAGGGAVGSASSPCTPSDATKEPATASRRATATMLALRPAVQKEWPVPAALQAALGTLEDSAKLQLQRAFLLQYSTDEPVKLIDLVATVSGVLSQHGLGAGLSEGVPPVLQQRLEVVKQQARRALDEEAAAGRATAAAHAAEGAEDGEARRVRGHQALLAVGSCVQLACTEAAPLAVAEALEAAFAAAATHISTNAAAALHALAPVGLPPPVLAAAAKIVAEASRAAVAQRLMQQVPSLVSNLLEQSAADLVRQICKEQAIAPRLSGPLQQPAAGSHHPTASTSPAATAVPPAGAPLPAAQQTHPQPAGPAVAVASQAAGTKDQWVAEAPIAAGGEARGGSRSRSCSRSPARMNLSAQLAAAAKVPPGRPSTSLEAGTGSDAAGRTETQQQPTQRPGRRITPVAVVAVTSDTSVVGRAADVSGSGSATPPGALGKAVTVCAGTDSSAAPAAAGAAAGKAVATAVATAARTAKAVERTCDHSVHLEQPPEQRAGPTLTRPLAASKQVAHRGGPTAAAAKGRSQQPSQQAAASPVAAAIVPAATCTTHPQQLPTELTTSGRPGNAGRHTTAADAATAAAPGSGRRTPPPQQQHALAELQGHHMAAAVAAAVLQQDTSGVVSLLAAAVLEVPTTACQPGASQGVGSAWPLNNSSSRPATGLQEQQAQAMTPAGTKGTAGSAEQQSVQLVTGIMLNTAELLVQAVAEGVVTLQQVEAALLLVVQGAAQLVLDGSSCTHSNSNTSTSTSTAAPSLLGSSMQQLSPGGVKADGAVGAAGQHLQGTAAAHAAGSRQEQPTAHDCAVLLCGAVLFCCLRSGWFQQAVWCCCQHGGSRQAPSSSNLSCASKSGVAPGAPAAGAGCTARTCGPSPEHTVVPQPIQPLLHLLLQVAKDGAPWWLLRQLRVWLQQLTLLGGGP